MDLKENGNKEYEEIRSKILKEFEIEYTQKKVREKLTGEKSDEIELIFYKKEESEEENTEEEESIVEEESKEEFVEEDKQIVEDVCIENETNKAKLKDKYRKLSKEERRRRKFENKYLDLKAECSDECESGTEEDDDMEDLLSIIDENSAVDDQKLLDAFDRQETEKSIKRTKEMVKSYKRKVKERRRPNIEDSSDIMTEESLEELVFENYENKEDLEEEEVLNAFEATVLKENIEEMFFDEENNLNQLKKEEKSFGFTEK